MFTRVKVYSANPTNQFVASRAPEKAFFGLPAPPP
jgi:hypothetical protein